MSCCNHFRDFLVLSSADLTRLTLVDAASCPAPGCQQIKNKTQNSVPVRLFVTLSRPRNVLACPQEGCLFFLLLFTSFYFCFFFFLGSVTFSS